MNKDTREKPPGAGKSSFELIDGELLFAELDLKKGSIFLDAACGKGVYSLEASRRVGDEGVVYALDLWEEGVALLKAQAADEGITNIQTLVGDLTHSIGIEDHRVDVCLLATVLHDFNPAHDAEHVLAEIARILKPDGLLAVIEFKKIDGPPGPPLEIRLSPDEVEALATSSGFRRCGLVDLGSYNYSLNFRSAAPSD